MSREIEQKRTPEKPRSKIQSRMLQYLVTGILASLQSDYGTLEQKERNDHIEDIGIFPDREQPHVSWQDFIHQNDSRIEAKKAKEHADWARRDAEHRAQELIEHPAKPFLFSERQRQTIEKLQSGSLKLSSETLDTIMHDLEWKYIDDPNESWFTVPKELEAVLDMIQLEAGEYDLADPVQYESFIKECVDIAGHVSQRSAREFIASYYHAKKRLVNEQYNNNSQHFVFTVHGPVEFTGLAVLGGTYPFDDFRFEGLPTEINTATIPQIRSLIQGVGNLVTGAGEYASYVPVVAEYFDTLRFGEEYPQALSPETLSAVRATAIKLNAVTITTPNGDLPGAEYQHIDHPKTMDASLAFGDYYLYSIPVTGFTDPEPNNLEAVRADWLNIDGVEQAVSVPYHMLHGMALNSHPDYERSPSVRYLQTADYSAFGVDFSFDTAIAINAFLFQVLEGGDKEIVKDGQFSNAPLFTKFACEFMKKNTFPEGVSDANFGYFIRSYQGHDFIKKGLFNEIYDVFEPSELQQEYTIYLEPNGNRASLDDFKDLSQQDSERLLGFGKPRIEGISSMITAEDLPKIVELFKKGINQNFLRAYFQRAKISPDTFSPKTYEELVQIADDWVVETDTISFTAKSQVLESLLLKGIDFSHLPVISLEPNYGIAPATSTAVDLPPEIIAFQSLPTSWQLKIRELRGEMENVPRVITPGSLVEIQKAYDRFSNFGMGTKYIEYLDYSQLPQEITDENLVQIAVLIDQLENQIVKKVAEVYAGSLKYLDFHSSQAETITDDNFDIEYAKARLNALNIIRNKPAINPPQIAMQVSTPRNLEEYLSFTAKCEKLIVVVGEKRATALQADVFTKIDWKGIAQYVPVLDIPAMERLRAQANGLVSSTFGDELLINLGAHFVDDEAVTWENLNAKVQYVETYATVGRNFGIDRDVEGMYKMLGSFQASKVIDFLESQNVDTDDARVIEYVQRMVAVGVEVPVEDSLAMKLWHNIDDPRRIIAKAVDAVWATNSVLRTEYAEATPVFRDIGVEGKTGYQILTIQNGETKLATVMIGNPEQGARVDYTVRVGGGLTVRHIQEKYGAEHIAAEAVGAYTTGAQKPAELVVDGGQIRNYLRSSREGMVIVNADGLPRIVHINDLNVSDIQSDAPTDVPLDIRHEVGDFLTFTRLASEQKIDVMAGHLLLYNGNLAIAGNSSASRDKRRLFITFADGRFGIADMTQGITLYEAAYILQKAGVMSAVNMDTGYYDQAVFYPKTEPAMHLGLKDQDGINNKFVLLSGNKEQN